MLLALLSHQSIRAAAMVRAEVPLEPLLGTCRDWLATFELGQRRLAAAHASSANDTQRGLAAVKRALAALSVMD